MSAFPHLVLQGGPRERGLRHGELASERIRHGLQSYRRRLQRRTGLSWAQARRLVREAYLDELGRWCPELLTEMAGIAEGADLPLDTILLLNARYELLRTTKAAACTSALVLPQASGGDTWLVMNWDYHPAVLDTAVILELRPSEEPAAILLAEAGQLGRAGLNEAGLGVVVNGLSSFLDRWGSGVPITLLRRLFLEERELGAGVERLLAPPRHVSNNVILAAPGEGIDYELIPDGALALRPDRGLLVHANHFEAQGHPPDRIGRRKGSWDRREAVYAALQAHRGAIDGELLWAVFSSHEGPQPLCRHETQTVTASCLLMNLEKREITLSMGPPCEAPARSFRVGQDAAGGSDGPG